MSSDEPIVLTVEIFPFKNGKRKIIVSGAPEGEMPIVRPALFAELHATVDAVFGELLHRKPQVVKDAARKKTVEPADDDDDEKAKPDQIGPATAAPTPPADLPAIEGAGAPAATEPLDAAAQELQEGLDG